MPAIPKWDPGWVPEPVSLSMPTARSLLPICSAGWISVKSRPRRGWLRSVLHPIFVLPGSFVIPWPLELRTVHFQGFESDESRYNIPSSYPRPNFGRKIFHHFQPMERKIFACAGSVRERIESEAWARARYSNSHPLLLAGADRIPWATSSGIRLDPRKDSTGKTTVVTWLMEIGMQGTVALEIKLPRVWAQIRSSVWVQF